MGLAPPLVIGTFRSRQFDLLVDRAAPLPSGTTVLKKAVMDLCRSFTDFRLGRRVAINNKKAVMDLCRSFTSRVALSEFCRSCNEPSAGGVDWM